MRPFQCSVHIAPQLLLSAVVDDRHFAPRIRSDLSRRAQIIGSRVFSRKFYVHISVRRKYRDPRVSRSVCITVPRRDHRTPVRTRGYIPFQPEANRIVGEIVGKVRITRHIPCVQSAARGKVQIAAVFVRTGCQRIPVSEQIEIPHAVLPEVFRIREFIPRNRTQLGRFGRYPAGKQYQSCRKRENCGEKEHENTFESNRLCHNFLPLGLFEFF